MADPVSGSVEVAQMRPRPQSRKSVATMPFTASGELDNQTTDISQLASLSATSVSRAKKSRSKSLGPGGLEALKEATGNRRKSIVAAPKSILKPTIPLSPLKEIPSRKPDVKSSSPSKSPSNTKSPKARSSPSKLISQSPGRQLFGQIDSTSRPSSRDGVTTPGKQQQQKQISPQKDEGAEARRKKREQIEEQRDLRRKSMANRRVSFAPEATLHTWDVVEYMHDSTASSSSPNSTRRASALSKAGDNTAASLTEMPSTPPAQEDETNLEKSPNHRREAHQKKRRRRSSGIPPMNFNDPDSLSSSPYSGVSIASDDDTLTTQTSEHTSNEGDSVVSDTTSGDVDNTTEDVSMEIDGDEDSNALDASLQEAAEQAGTKGIGIDDNGDVSMDIAGDDVTVAFKPWVRQSNGMSSPHPRGRTSMDSLPSPTSPGMTMEMTRAVGGIVPSKGAQPSKRRQSMRRGQSSIIDSRDEESMEITTAIGGIQHRGSLAEEAEDMSMEFTTALGQIRNKKSTDGNDTLASQHLLLETQQSSPGFDDDDGDMEITRPVGSIRSQHPINDETAGMDMEMDMTRPLGRILGYDVNKDGEINPDKENEPPEPRKTRASPSASTAGNPTVSMPPQNHDARISQTPEQIPGGSTLRRSPPTIANPQMIPGGKEIPRTPQKQVTPSSTKPQTPQKQMTPLPPKPRTPAKTPPSANISMRKQSPKKLFQKEIKAQTPQLFRPGPAGGSHTPSIILAPRNNGKRQSLLPQDSIDETVSPKIAALLNRRASIGEKADVFAPADIVSRGVKFEDPRAMEMEVSRDQEEDSRRESRQFMIEKEANDQDVEKDATANLRELIDAMTPRKPKSKGRKSLAVGAAKGVLGKRPAELDESDSEGSPQTFGHEGSPVKKVKLDGPFQNDPFGKSSRIRRSAGQLPGDRPKTPTTNNTMRSGTISTPRSHGKFKDAEALPNAQNFVPAMGQSVPMNVEQNIQEEQDDNITLQDFLNLTNIKFMDLAATKRRPTAAAKKLSSMNDDAHGDAPSNSSQYLENCVVAGACTLPMLELFQHSCRELKKYIAEGRDVVKEIEAATLDENPPLVKKYLSSSPTDRAAMDSQLKNMKTNARLLSKGTWYEWRTKLLEGLQESLAQTAASLNDDDAILAAQEAELEIQLPVAQQEHTQLTTAHNRLLIRTEALAGSDPEELEAARLRLQALDDAIKAKKDLLDEQRHDLRETDVALQDGYEMRDEFQAAITRAHAMKEECRGWTGAEVAQLRTQVRALEKRTGWAVIAASGNLLTMSYKGQLELSFSPHSQEGLSLTYIASTSITTPRRFFLQSLRAALHVTPRTPSEMIDTVSKSWTAALRIETEIQSLAMRLGITEAHILSDDKLGISCAVLVREMRTRVDVTLEVVITASASGARLGNIDVKVPYGAELKQERMRDFLAQRLRGWSCDGVEGAWATALDDMKTKALAKVRK